MDTHQQDRAHGFTLVELMVVIVILGGLIALVGPNVWQALKGSDIQIAETQMSNFQTSMELYYTNNRKMPGSLEELTQPDPKTNEPYLTDIPLDPWGTPYELKAGSGREFQLISYGEDRIEGTEDDVVWPKHREE